MEAEVRGLHGSSREKIFMMLSWAAWHTDGIDKTDDGFSTWPKNY
jgi:hypothetical protein